MGTISERPSNMSVLENAYRERYSLTEAVARWQLESPAVQKVIILLAEEDGLLSRAVQDELERKKRDLALREQALRENRAGLETYAHEIKKHATHVREAEEQLNQRQTTLSELEDRLLELELSESRDRLRLFQVYLDSCRPVTDANRTWWLAGCASILSGSPVPGSTRKDDTEQREGMLNASKAHFQRPDHRR